MLCKPCEAYKEWYIYIFLKQAIGTLEMIKATLCICSRVGLISPLSLPFCFFLFPVKPVTSQSFWKSSEQSWQFFSCTICLLWWCPLSRAYHELYLTSLEVFSAIIAPALEAVQQHLSALWAKIAAYLHYIYSYKKFLIIKFPSVLSECDARITHLASHGLHYKGTAQCLSDCTSPVHNHGAAFWIPPF